MKKTTRRLHLFGGIVLLGLLPYSIHAVTTSTKSHRDNTGGSHLAEGVRTGCYNEA